MTNPPESSDHCDILLAEDNAVKSTPRHVINLETWGHQRHSRG
jgi:hypothetical protein